MTRQEFDEWLSYHTSAFTSVGQWLDGISKEQIDGKPSERAQTLRHWFGVLRHVDLADAKAATDKLFGGRVDGTCPMCGQLRSRDRTPWMVATITRQWRSAREARIRLAKRRAEVEPTNEDRAVIHRMCQERIAKFAKRAAPAPEGGDNDR
jgi:hypothetical protein